MRKATKIWLITAASLVLLGCILFVGVMTALKWDFSKLSTVKYETNTHEISESFGDISLTTDTADIMFALSGDGKCRVECYEGKNAKHSASVQSRACFGVLAPDSYCAMRMSTVSGGKPAAMPSAFCVMPRSIR